MNLYGTAHGQQLVKAARNCIELFLIDPEFNRSIVTETLQDFDKKHGIFVSIRHYPTMEMRGCMGFLKPEFPIRETLLNAAISAAFEDPKFVSISKQELEHIVIEVDVLSGLELLKGGKQRPRSMKIPGDGVMVEYGHRQGIVLPVVAVEKKLDGKGLLEEACRRAGIHANYWMQPNVKAYRFEAQAFREESPDGRIVEVRY